MGLLSMNKRAFTFFYFFTVLIAFVLGQTHFPARTEAVSLDSAQVRQPVLADGLYFTDETQTRLFTGGLKEYYDNGVLKLEMIIINGKPEGPYVVYFPSSKPKEVRSYLNGKNHGVWRTYNENGMLTEQAEYLNDKKHGRWCVWDDNGILRYEMQYTKGKKTGTWYMWDEKGRLILEKKYD